MKCGWIRTSYKNSSNEKKAKCVKFHKKNRPKQRRGTLMLSGEFFYSFSVVSLKCCGHFKAQPKTFFPVLGSWDNFPSIEYPHENDILKKGPSIDLYLYKVQSQWPKEARGVIPPKKQFLCIKESFEKDWLKFRQWLHNGTRKIFVQNNIESKIA